MVKIAINATSVVAGGGVTYIKNLLTGLSKTETVHHYVVLTTTAGWSMLYFRHPRFTFLPLKIPSLSPLFRLLWEQTLLVLLLKRLKVDVLFSPANVAPLFSKIPNVAMIQNIEPFGNTVSVGRGLLSSLRLKLLKWLTVLSINKSQGVVFPSTKACRVVGESGVSLKHAEVVYHGIDGEMFHPLPCEQPTKKYDLGRFILFVSNIQRYKNFLELIQAFALLKGKIDDRIRLVFAGRCFDAAYYRELNAFITAQKLEDRIVFLGEVPYGHLPYLYASCVLFVNPSTCESFGMAMVEAMSCGAPILASNREPMPEICGEAATCFDPTDPAAIAEALFVALNDPSVLSTMRANSIKRARFFSWENTATRVLEILEGVFDKRKQ
ncbi:MAG: glycosyltransferase family 1 protein [Planctomycetota bacterium]